ncbi:MAG: helix-turn-helix domain-containing protein, partial [Isosphaeraceae bacterium]
MIIGVSSVFVEKRTDTNNLFLEPIAKGLHITHWSSQDLARQAVEDGIVGSISPATVRRLLHDV